MIKIDVSKIELESFIDSIKSDYDKLKPKIHFNDFKSFFCDDNLIINDEKLNKKYGNKKITLFKEIYGFISSSNSKFYLKLRTYIIETFTKKIKYCPYCGKSPLIFFDKKRDLNNGKCRLFQFDHFFPKNSFHIGIINFYNLIPSCNSCNHLKGDNNPLDVILERGKIFHPYFGYLYINNQGKLIKEGLNNFDKKTSFCLNDKNNYIFDEKIDNKHSEFFNIPQKYLNSQDTFNIFNFIQDKRTKIMEEQQRFKKSFKSEDELKDYFFKNYSPEKEIEILKFSNGKLKKDLIENLKLPK